MKITVHRGLQQIGGCITEISTDSSRIFVDMGQNLPGTAAHTSPKEDEEMVKNLLAENKKEHEAVFYTHGHEDHIGLFMYVGDEIAQYMSEGTKEMILVKYQLIAKSLKAVLGRCQDDAMRKQEERKYEEAKQKETKLEQFNTWPTPGLKEAPHAIRIGDIDVTPFYCNHSIFDSSMFLIEADGKKIWHTGDFRSHGYTGNLYAMLKKYAVDIDTLIIEGTMLNQVKTNITEKEVSDKMANVMKAFRYVFVLCSATDIDRLAGIQHACDVANKPFYISSPFMEKTMKIFTRRVGVKRRLFHFEPKMYKKQYLGKMKQEGFTIAIGASQYAFARLLRDELDPSETLLIYSSWDGYYKIAEQIEHNKEYKEFRDLFHNVVDIHTSGHADRDTLKKVIEIVNPKEEIIGIHKEKGASHGDIMSNDKRASNSHYSDKL